MAHNQPTFRFKITLALGFTLYLGIKSMNEGHFQNERRAILLYYAPQFENVPTLGLYSTLLSLDLGSTKILFFFVFFSFPPLSLGVTYDIFLFFWWSWWLPHHEHSRVPFLWPTAEWKPKKIVSTMDGPILYIWLSGVITIMLSSLISV
jgi:hypothetical protein